MITHRPTLSHAVKLSKSDERAAKALIISKAKSELSESTADNTEEDASELVKVITPDIPVSNKIVIKPGASRFNINNIFSLCDAQGVKPSVSLPSAHSSSTAALSPSSSVSVPLPESQSPLSQTPVVEKPVVTSSTIKILPHFGFTSHIPK